MSQREVSIADAAIERGIAEIRKRHPELSERYLRSHIDQSIQEEYFGKINEYVNTHGKKWNDQEKVNFLYDQLSQAVASGVLFDKGGKEFILKRGRLEHRVKGGTEIDHVLSAFHEMYSLMPEETAKRNPELARAIATLEDARFMDAALDLLDQHGVVPEHHYRQAKKDLAYKIGEEAQGAIYSITKYLAPKKKVAAAILGMSGALFILLAGSGITGNAIGQANPGSGILSGLLLIVSSILLIKT